MATVLDEEDILVCLSNDSVTKSGVVQWEIRQALNVADEQPEGAIFLIPVRLEDCSVPDRLRKLHRVDVFAANGYDRLLRSLGRTPTPPGQALPPRAARDAASIPDQPAVVAQDPSQPAVPPTTRERRSRRRLFLTATAVLLPM